MASMRAVAIDEWGGAPGLRDLPVPEPGPGEVLVAVQACGVGLTLESARAGDMGGSVPRVLGHEFSGAVERRGAGVTGWAEGDPVTGSFYLLCGRCDMCTSGRETLCRAFRGFIGTAADGALAEYLVVPAENLVRIPDGVPMAHAGVVADAVATTYHAARERARLMPDQRAAVIGAGGGLGVHMIEMARAFGCETFAVERDAAKLERLRADGRADVVVDASGDDWAADLAERTGGRLDACFDFVCSSDTMTGAFGALGAGGTLVLAGFRPGALPVVPPPAILKELTVTGSRYASRAEIERTLALVARGSVRTVVGATFALEDAGKAFAAVQANDVYGRIVVDVALPTDQEAEVPA